MEAFAGIMSQQELQVAIARADAVLRRMRSQLAWRSIIGFSCGAALALLSLVLPGETRYMALGFAFYVFIGMGVYVFVKRAKVSNAALDAEVLRARKEMAERSLGAPAPSAEASSVSYFDQLVNINVTNLGAYYQTVKFHANNSFIVTVAIAGVGFLFILGGLLIGLFKADQRYVGYVSAASGVMVEFISGVFFYLYNKTVRQLKEYHDSLLAVQNILLSFKMVGDISQEAERVKMIGQVIGYLIRKPEAEAPPAKLLAKIA